MYIVIYFYYITLILLDWIIADEILSFNVFYSFLKIILIKFDTPLWLHDQNVSFDTFLVCSLNLNFSH